MGQLVSSHDTLKFTGISTGPTYPDRQTSGLRHLDFFGDQRRRRSFTASTVGTGIGMTRAVTVTDPIASIDSAHLKRFLRLLVTK